MKAPFQYKIARVLLYLLFRIIFGLEIEGISNVPKEGSVIIAPNHRSNYDPLLVGCCVDSRGVYYLAKSGLFTSKAVACFLRSLNVIPVDLEKPAVGALRTFVNLLKKGKAIMVFPEGTRSRTNKYLKALPGVGYLAVRTNSTVIPTLIEGTYESMTRHFLRRSPLRVRFGTPIYPENEVKSVKEAEALSIKILEEVKRLA